MKKFVFILLLAFLTTGCWDEREIRDLGIINSFLLDYKDGKIIFIAEIINSETQSAISPTSSGEIPYLYIRGEGEKIVDATNNSTLALNKYLYTAHIKAIFISEDFAKEKGLVPLMDLFSRYPELRQSEYIVVIKDKDPQSLYKSSVSLGDYFGDFIEESKKTQTYRLSKSTYTKMLDVIRAYYCDMEEPAVGVIQKVPVDKNEQQKNNPVTGSIVEDNTKVLYEGLAVFEKDKLKYLVNGEDTLMYNFLLGKAKAININIEQTTFKVVNDKPKIDIKFKEDKVSINVKLSLEMMVTMDEGKNDFTKIKTIKEFQKKIDIKLSKEIQTFMNKAQNTIGVDFFNFASAFHIKYPKEWKKIKKNWDDYFKKADIKIEVKSTIKNVGKIEKSVRNEA